ncbi:MULTISPECIES: histidinol-phosphate transaminase [Vibrio]|uniref:histidinol-phosphate transaminase n=1 Tax=Vibrio TaxID=662 RepID=UPI00207537BC|nr:MULTISPECIES: histidinol-phosphate transaminase [Vibrio]USD34959.1 histidinol-phosphate transaminase [Vibrio sp. SCSIO 43186]USD48024.1 histidinol-phosphate transaminase [Vibrio sp. SCSIO 43145]USD72083.1 histidinol-phosphate transaminase [Vibrio sp. SCSIO 43139]USD97753.1 histidinol-phosphate transaminase [Vibrio coralliilyticus]
MMSLADKIAPDNIKKLIPYQSARRIGGSGRLWLNANELEQPLHFNEQQNAYHRYPDFLPHDIASAYQDYCQTRNPALAVRGADEAIDLLVRTFCQPGKSRIAICSPTYAMYEFCADSLAVETIDIPLLAPDFALDVEGVVKAAESASLIFLCSPNNPTGQLLKRHDILSILEQTQEHALIVVDEAYIEFELEESVVSLIEQYPNLVVIRTLSKAFGLAAVRCGFIIADTSVMNYLNKMLPPYPMPDSSAEIVLNALSSEGLAQVRANTKKLIATKEWFVEQIQSFEWIEKVYPSATNFILIRTRPDVDLFNYLLNAGVVTRNQAHEPSLKHCVRITIGSQESMQEVATIISHLSNPVSTKNKDKDFNHEQSA